MPEVVAGGVGRDQVGDDDPGAVGGYVQGADLVSGQVRSGGRLGDHAGDAAVEVEVAVVDRDVPRRGRVGRQWGGGAEDEVATVGREPACDIPLVDQRRAWAEAPAHPLEEGAAAAPHGNTCLAVGETGIADALAAEGDGREIVR